LDDAAVIEASRAEPDRFASLFDRHAPYIHRYLFDPRTFAYLGMTTWGEQGQLGGGALVQTAIVDRAGEMP
jgi:hypothetical protein